MAENFTIDRKNKTFIFDDGQVLPIPKDKEKEVLRSPHAQNIKKQAKETESKEFNRPAEFEFLEPVNQALKPVAALSQARRDSLLGNPGEQLFDYVGAGVGAFSPGEGQEDLGYLDRVLENFYATREGKKEAREGIAEQYPIASGIGKGLGIAGEIGALGNLPGAAAFPISGALHSEKSILEPSEKLPELAGEAAGGYLLDRFLGGLGRVAASRQARRDAVQGIENVTARNAQETELAANATLADRNRFAAETAARDAELAALPGLQEAENTNFVANLEGQISKATQKLGKNGVNAEIFPIEEFIENGIARTPRAATPEGRQGASFIRSVFKPNAEGKLTAQEIQQGFSSLQKRINTSEGELKNILTEFRDYNLKRLPETLSNAIAYEKVVPKVLKTATKDIEKDVLNTVKSDIGLISKSNNKVFNEFNKLINDFKIELEGSLSRNYSNFSASAQDGSLVTTIAEDMRDLPRFEKLQKMVQAQLDKIQKNYGRIDPAYDAYSRLQATLEELPIIVSQATERSLQKHLPDIHIESVGGQDVLNRRLSNIQGNPRILPEPAPINPAQTIEPNLQPVPTIPEPTDTAGRLGAFLENATFGSAKESLKNGLATPGALVSHALGLPLAKLTAGAGAGVMGLKALTSPGIGGQALRGGISLSARLNSMVEQKAMKYATYHDGVVDDPMERRSLVKEIESDQEMSLGDKALYQSKINRGEPIFKPITKM